MSASLNPTHNLPSTANSKIWGLGLGFRVRVKDPNPN